jgi:hypothetical protein
VRRGHLTDVGGMEARNGGRIHIYVHGGHGKCKKTRKTAKKALIAAAASRLSCSVPPWREGILRLYRRVREGGSPSARGSTNAECPRARAEHRVNHAPPFPSFSRIFPVKKKSFQRSHEFFTVPRTGSLAIALAAAICLAD